MSWSDDVVERVWQKGRAVPSNEPGRWRKDDCDAWIGRADYGDRTSQYGWEIDHINPNGGDGLNNLRPLQWQNNVDKTDGRLRCNVTANGKDNLKRS